MLTEVEVQGTLLRMRPRTLYFKGKSVNHARGKITGFSRKSRGRLIERMARLDVEKTRTVFLTLTITAIVSDKTAKLYFHRFRMKLQRRFPRMSAMWRKELQKRGAIHFHLICFNMPFWLQAAIQKAWEECTGEETSIVHVKLLRNKRQAMYYVSKYIAKFTQSEETTSLDNVPYLNDTSQVNCGRHWGYIKKALLPHAEKLRAFLLEADVEGYLRFTIRALSKGRCAKGNGRITLYSDEVHAILRKAVDWGGFYVETDDFNDFAAILSGSNPYSFVGGLYAIAHPRMDWKKVYDSAYAKFQTDWLTRQALSAGISYIDRKR